MIKMGARDTLQDLKQRRQAVAENLQNELFIERLHKRAVKENEKVLIISKRNRNKSTRDRKALQAQLEKLDARIKSLPRAAREYGKKHPLAGLEKVS
jgi:hypothetical protein